MNQVLHMHFQMKNEGDGMKKLAKTKQKLLQVLKKEGQMTIDDMMAHFTISEIAVRKHLRELERDSYIKKKSVKQSLGRPYYVYQLTRNGHILFPNQFEQLPLDLLKDLETLQGREAVSDLLQQRMKRETKDIQEEVTAVDFLEKVSKIAAIQDQKGCMVEVNETPDGDFEIIHFNCPIANIAQSYHEICQNEKHMYRDVFPETEVISKSRITVGDHCCCWVIKNPKNA